MLPPSVALFVFAFAEIKRKRNKKDPNHRGRSSISNFCPLVKVFFNIYCGFSGVFYVFCAKELLNAQPRRMLCNFGFCLICLPCFVFYKIIKRISCRFNSSIYVIDIKGNSEFNCITVMRM